MTCVTCVLSMLTPAILHVLSHDEKEWHSSERERVMDDRTFSKSVQVRPTHFLPELQWKSWPSMEVQCLIAIPGDSLRAWPISKPWNWPSSQSTDLSDLASRGPVKLPTPGRKKRPPLGLS